MPPNTGVAPICNALAEPPNFISKAPPLPKFTPPSPDSPQSIIMSILQIQQTLIALTNQPPPNNTIPSFPTGGGGGAGGGAVPGKPGKKTPQQNAEWVETNRQTQNVKVVNPDDDSQFVIVKEIILLEFTHSTTGETIVFLRDPV